jgi:hypothetical protein
MGPIAGSIGEKPEIGTGFRFINKPESGRR